MRERRLQSYLMLVLFVAATVPTIVVGTYELVRVRASYARAIDAQRERAVTLSQEVAAYVETHARAVRTLARQLESVDDVTKLDLQHFLDTMRAEYPGIVGTFIGDAQGNALAFSPPVDRTGRPLAGRNFKDASYFEPIMRTKEMVYSNVGPGAVINGNPLVTMVVPLLDRQGNVRNYISLGLNLSMLSEWLSAHQKYHGETLLLVDNRNTLIAVSGSVTYEPFANLSDHLHIQKMRAQSPWWESESALGGYATIPEHLDWGVAIITPRTALFAEVRSAMGNAAVAVSLALVLGWAMAWLLARRMNQPVAALMKAAVAVRQGDMQARVNSPRRLMPREMAELHDSFNEMVAALQQSQGELMRLNSTLEERVEERTRQVTRRSQELAVLNATAVAVTDVRELPDRLNEIASGIVQLVGADVGLVALRAPDGPLDLKAMSVPKINWRPPVREELSRGLAATLISDGQPVIIADAAAHRHLFGAWADDYPHASVCGVPIRSGGDIVGVLGAINVQPDYFDAHSVELLSTLAGQVGPAVSGAWLFDKLQEQWNTMVSITNSMHEGLLLVNPEHRVQFANTAAAVLLGLKAQPPAGTPLTEFFTYRSSGNPEAVLAPIVAKSVGVAPSVVDIELPGPRHRTVAATTFPVRGEGVAQTGYGILLRDVTQERQLERSKDDLIANVSHELRTPLTTILGNAATLISLGATIEPEEQAEFLDGIAEESRRLKELIESVLDMSRISSGALHLDRHPEALHSLVARALRRAGQRWPKHQFAANLPPDLPLVDVDADRMDQVLDNLMNNAAQYSPPGSTVTVEAKSHDDFVQTAVRDTGEGIGKENLERVFERFYRGDNPQVRRVRGTGLGLAICRGILKAHGGHIWAESVPGEGSTFTLTLPIAAAGREGEESA